MKKLISTIVACFFVITVFSQDTEEQSAPKVNLLPEAGDFALGFDAAPLLNFALNLVNIMDDTGDRAQHPGYVQGFNNVIVGKYFLEDYMAVRARFGINTDRVTTSIYGDDPLDENPVPANILLQKESNRMSDYFLGAGLEFRRGYERIQGFYGAEALFGLGTDKTLFEYTIDYNQNADDEGIIAQGDSRPLEILAGSSYTIGVRGFVGIEYFIVPKLSIAAEFGWGVGYVTTPRGEIIIEHWDIQAGSDEIDPYQYTVTTEGNFSESSFGFGVDDGISKALGGSAALSLIFHF